MLHLPRRRLSAAALALLLLLTTLLGGCLDISDPARDPAAEVDLATLSVVNAENLTLRLGESIQLITNADEKYGHLLSWSTSNGCVSVSDLGYVVAHTRGEVTITVTLGQLSDSVLVTVVDASELPPEETTAPETAKPGETTPALPADTDSPDDPGLTAPPPKSDLTLPEAEKSPAGWKPAASYGEAIERSLRGEISGYLTVPDQAPILARNRPMQGGQYVRNNQPYFADENTYVVVDVNGCEVFRVYRGGGYITLEEVAAYVYAFGDIPANYVSGKTASPTSSIWGEYLRLNHSKFSGNTSKYPYEPELPDISGCGGDLTYYEMDIGTTGTDCSPGYAVRTYNDGNRITRGAARIVYARFDANRNQIIDPNERFLFYTYNHYNDFREYLNYYGGWGEMFGNITGGGTLSSKTDYNPTAYPAVAMAPLRSPQRKTLWHTPILVDFPTWRDEMWAA